MVVERLDMGTPPEQWPTWLSATAPYAKLLLTAVVGFFVGQRLERIKAAKLLENQAMADIIRALNEVESVAGDLKVRLSIWTVDDHFVVTKEISAEERQRLTVESARLRELAGRLARFPDLSRVAEELGGRASFVMHLAELEKESGLESGQVTQARRELRTLFEKLVDAKDRALKLII